MLSDKSDFSYEMENNKINHQSIIAAKYKSISQIQALLPAFNKCN